ncbi:MAG: endonuclease/exonuclease/phosphatase family protein, partial [Pseudomonadota bacterium]
MSRDGPGLLLRDILKGDEQVTAWRRVVQAADADILVIGDIDFDLHGLALAALIEPLEDYPHRFTRQPNRGLHMGHDRDGDGRLGSARDAEGYGEFAGQGGMAVLSRLPIDLDAVRDFSTFAWADLPDTLALGDGRDPIRLSTTAHWAVPVTLPDGNVFHLLTWHATAPVFDGPEDRNGRRNHDEARFWHLFLEGKLGLPVPERFVLLGTANADPRDGDSRPDAIRGLLTHAMLQDPQPSSAGGTQAAARDGGVNTAHISPSALDTADWPDEGGYPGNLRVDYVLPSARLRVLDSGVIWPTPDVALGRDVERASRH